MQFFLQRLLEDLLQKEITEEERVYLIVHISRTTQKKKQDNTDTADL